MYYFTNNVMYVCVPEIFFLISIFIIFGFYLVQVFQVTVSGRSKKDTSFLFFQILKFSTYNLFFISFLFIYQFSFLKSLEEPVFFFNSMIRVDAFSTFFKFFIVLLSAFILSASTEFFIKSKFFSSEYIIIFLVFVFSLITGLSANDFLLFYISLELQSLCVYILLIQNKNQFNSLKAVIKYFFYSIISSAFFLIGLSFIYFMFGSFNYSNLNLLFSTSSLEFKNSLICILSQVFIFFVIFFKLGVTPFHDWVPSVYAYSNLPTVFAVSTVSKIFAFFVLIQFLFIFDAAGSSLLIILYWVGIFSVCFGVFGAFLQTEVLKIIGYSAIAHLGYSLIILSFFDANSIVIALFYFLVYIFLSFSFFYVFVSTFKISSFKKLSQTEFRQLRFIYDFNGVVGSNWLLALFFSTIFFSYSGIPPFIGFYSKYFMFYYLIQNGYFITFFFLFLMSVISTYYYLSILVSIYFSAPKFKIPKITYNNSIMLVLFIILNIFLVFGINNFFIFIISFFLCLISCFL